MYIFERLSKIRFTAASLGTFVATLAITLLVLGAPVSARVIPSTSFVNFSSQAVGSAGSPLNITLTNTSSRSTTIVSASLSAPAFTFSGISLPMILSPGQTAVVTITFAPLAQQSYFGALVIARDFGSPTFIRLSGMGVANDGGQTGQPASHLSANVTALSFVNTDLSSSTSQSVTFTDNGSSNIAISGVSISGAGFSLAGSPTGTGISGGMILAPGQTTAANVTFAPAASGNVTGSLIVTSNAANSPTVIALSGMASSAAPPAAGSSVALSWMPSESTVVGYKAYSSTVSGGPYAAMNASPVPGTSYVDSSVEPGQTYYFVVTAVDSSNQESAFSNEASITVH